MKKNIKEIINIGIIALFIVLCMSYNNSYAGFADFDDETADKQAVEDLKNQELQDEQNKGKSNNNYLKELKVKDFKITPEFDKQIIDYVIEEEIEDKEIIIEAIPFDEKALVLGVGKQILQSGKNTFEIEVQAENGIKRTYYITVNKKVEDIRINELKLFAINNNEKEKIDINPNFDKDVFEYNCTVNYDVENIEIEVPKKNDYNIQINGNKNLIKGKNIITIAVKSKENNSEVVYKINVNRNNKYLNKENNKLNETKKKEILSIIILILIISLLIMIINKKGNKKRKH